MPTFSFSDNELRKLVRFFQALSQQPMPYIPEHVPTLTAKETDMARSLFSSTAAPCLKCHATGDPAHDKNRHRAQLPAGQRASEAGLGGALGARSRRPSAPERRCLRACSARQGQWVFAGPTPPSFQGYDKDHSKLLVDYIFQLTPEEQRRVARPMGRTRASNQPPANSKTAMTASASQRAMSGGSR